MPGLFQHEDPTQLQLPVDSSMEPIAPAIQLRLGQPVFLTQGVPVREEQLVQGQPLKSPRASGEPVQVASGLWQPVSGTVERLADDKTAKWSRKIPTQYFVIARTGLGAGMHDGCFR